MAQGVQSPGGRRGMGRALLSVGLIGAAFTALCCFAPFLIAGILAAIGLGFLLNDAILIGLLVLSLALVALGYHLMRRQRIR